LILRFESRDTIEISHMIVVAGIDESSIRVLSGLDNNPREILQLIPSVFGNGVAHDDTL
jgi:hypothetical protein